MTKAMVMVAAVLLWSLFGAKPERKGGLIKLPRPDVRGNMTVESALSVRRSCRRFADQRLSPAQVGQIAWAAQGVTAAARGYRTAPSAGALYPMEIFLVDAEGVYHYAPRDHGLRVHRSGDQRSALAQAALGQSFVARAPLNVVVAAVYERVTRKYGERGRMYVHMEAGHIGQNVLLQATAMGLAGVPVGAFHPAEVSEVLGLPAECEPIYILTVGHAATR